MFRQFIEDTNGDAMVEAAILFPIIIMIFAALVMLSIYLPIKATLQRATQYAATAIATTKSDTWLEYDDDSMSFKRIENKDSLMNVYVALFTDGYDVERKGRNIVTTIEGRIVTPQPGELLVDADINNMLVYKEIVVTATREFKPPVKLPFISFPEEFKITVTSTAVVQNGDEFVRNMDLAVDFFEYIIEKFHLTNITDSISKFGKQVSSLMGW